MGRHRGWGDDIAILQATNAASCVQPVAFALLRVLCASAVNRVCINLQWAADMTSEGHAM